MWTGRSKAGGFSLLELVIVIVIISVLATTLMTRLLRTQAEAEQAAMEAVAGALKSALGLKFAELYVHGDKRGMQLLAGSNPMDRLSQKPKNYLGEVRRPDVAQLAQGNWYFDKDRGELVYLVNNAEYFSGGAGKPPRARFVIRLVVNERRFSGYRVRRALEGVDLIPVEPYQWRKG